MSTTNCEKDSLSGQRVLSPEPKPFLEGLFFFSHPLLSINHNCPYYTKDHQQLSKDHQLLSINHQQLSMTGALFGRCHLGWLNNCGKAARFLPTFPLSVSGMAPRNRCYQAPGHDRITVRHPVLSIIQDTRSWQDHSQTSSAVLSIIQDIRHDISLAV